MYLCINTVFPDFNYSAHEFIFNKTTNVEPVKKCCKNCIIHLCHYYALTIWRYYFECQKI